MGFPFPILPWTDLWHIKFLMNASNPAHPASDLKLSPSGQYLPKEWAEFQEKLETAVLSEPLQAWVPPALRKASVNGDGEKSVKRK